jgi:hypothetical protein
MPDVTVYHLTSADNLDTLQREGLRYGSQGARSREDHAAKTNKLLDGICPARLWELHVSRQGCIYAFAELEGKILDIAEGKAYPPADFPVDDGSVLLRLAIAPETAFVSDLDAYDSVARAIETDQPITALRTLADTYWQRIITLPELITCYRLTEDGLQAIDTVPASLPRHFKRVDLMLTTDIPPAAITQA